MNPTEMLAKWALDTTCPLAEANRRAEAYNALTGLTQVATRILLAHESGNNGAINGEAVLCPAFATGLRHELLACGVTLPERAS